MKKHMLILSSLIVLFGISLATENIEKIEKRNHIHKSQKIDIHSVTLLMAGLRHSSKINLQSPSDKIILAKKNDTEGTIHINGENPRCSLVTLEPVKQNKFCMEVNMYKKKLKTAIGVMAEGKSFKYMRTDPIGEDFVSFGGAGFIHPEEITSDKGYRQGDIVKVQIDFRKDPKERISFFVNGDVVGVTGWNFEQAYFALSVDENGEAGFDVKFEME